MLCWFVCLSLFFSLFLPQPRTRLHSLFHPVMIQRFYAPFTCSYRRQCERGAENPHGTFRIAASSKERERTKALTKRSFLREVVRSHVVKYFYHFHLIMPGKSLQSLYVCASKSDTQSKRYIQALHWEPALGDSSLK